MSSENATLLGGDTAVLPVRAALFDWQPAPGD